MRSTPDPCEIDDLRRRVASTLGPAAAARIHTRRIVIEDDALPALRAAVAEHAGTPGRAVLVWDDRPMGRGTDELKPLLHQALMASGVSVRIVELPRDLHADEAAAAGILDALEADAVVVSVGSGNLTDTCKHACHIHAQRTGRHVPLLCWPTANSVNAYSSSLAILVVNGVKRSLASIAPDVILCDLPTLMSAPASMQRAGLGDMMARCVAQGDWYLAHELGMDEAYSTASYELLDDTVKRMLAAAGGIGEQTVAGTRVLAEALNVSGLVLSAAKQSAPLSGWEHVISHHLDLTALAKGRRLGLHGAQVGVAAVLSARAFNVLIEQGRPDAAVPAQVFAEPDAIKAQIDTHFGPLDPDGSRRVELWRDVQAKLSQWHGQEQRWHAFCSAWQAGRIQSKLRSLVRPWQTIRDALIDAGAPTTFSQLDPPVAEPLARAAIQHAHLVRQRFTLGDLLSACGLLTKIVPDQGGSG